MNDEPTDFDDASAETVAVARRRRETTRRMTRKQTELRLEALAAIPAAPRAVQPEDDRDEGRESDR